MARFKDYSYEQTIMIPISLKDQILPGTFEHTLHTVINQLDLSMFQQRYANDLVGAPAYDPAILLKIILYAYSKGINSSRNIAVLATQNVVCMALAAEQRPHFTTIADFISSRDQECTELFTKVLAICYAENLIGAQMFAIDGCKISSNCSKEWSGTKAELVRKVAKIKKSMEFLVNKHQQNDGDNEDDTTVVERERQSIERLKAKVTKITSWLEESPDKLGSSGKPIKSNITDNESAKMATSHGVIQGYNGIAAVDEKHQTIIWAGAFGDSNEASHLPEVLEGIETTCEQANLGAGILQKVKLTADTGYHSEASIKAVFDRGIDAYIPDRLFRKRDIRFTNVLKYKKRTADWQPSRGQKYFQPKDFVFDEVTGKLVCPAGKALWLKTPNFQSSGGRYTGVSYMGHIHDCESCDLRLKCLRKETTKARQVTIFSTDATSRQVNYSALMQKRIDTLQGRSEYSKRMGIVEPVFGHIRGTKNLDRFTLRGRKKVNTQWLLYCIVHNMGKIQKYGSKKLK
jgi:transposase